MVKLGGKPIQPTTLWGVNGRRGEKVNAEMLCTVDEVVETMHVLENEEQRMVLMRFFKTGVLIMEDCSPLAGGLESFTEED